tara:strand:+ start:112 stop:819 length:708 start_codon:yes stop_codon:yes gene_type:complete
MRKKSQKSVVGKASSNSLESFLEKLSKVPQKKNPNPGRIIFGIDATASRQPLWDKASHIQSEMFDSALSLGGLKMKIAYYQGFKKFNSFPWIDNSDKLIKLMENVNCLGGLTQINRFLEYSLEESNKSNINAIIFIGDCVEENYDLILNTTGKISLKGIPIFIFQEGSDPNVKFVFSEIARITNGIYSVFDSSSSKTLKNLLKAIAIFAAGGKDGLRKKIDVAPIEIKLLLQKMK